MFQSKEYRLAGLFFAVGAALIAMSWALRAWIASLLPEMGSDALGWSIVLVATMTAGAAFAAARAWERRAERRADQWQNLIADRAGWCVIATDADGVVSSFSAGAEKILGYGRAEVVGRMRLEAVRGVATDAVRLALRSEPSAAALADSNLRSLVASGSSAEVERDLTIFRRDGGARSFHGNVSVICGPARKQKGFLLVAADATALRSAEARIKEVESRFEKNGAHIPGMLFQLRQAVDGQRSMPFVTEGVRRIFRHLPAAGPITPAEIWSVIHPDDVVRFAETMERSAATLTRWECEYRVRFPDGIESWLRSAAVPERDADGAVVWNGFTDDVSERKRAEQAHEESRVLLQSVFSSVDLGVFVVEVAGEDFRYSEINPAYERLTGLVAAEIRGRSPRDLPPLISGHQAESLCASFRCGTESTGPIEYEESFNARGKPLWLLTRLTPLRDPAGKVVRLVGRSLDITERKTIELRFQSLTERLQLATEAAQVGIWDHDFVNDRLMWDSRMHTLYGIAPRDFDASLIAWSERIHADDRQRVLAELDHALDGKGAFNTSFRIVRPDGQERQIRARAHVQRGSAGRATRMVGVNWDVTAERRAQSEIEKARDQAEVLNHQLEEALDRAQRLAREAAAATVAKSEFLANMSHEIRTPLNAVLGMSGVLLGTALTREQREFAETIRASGDGLLDLLNDILDYSKIESGRLDLEVRPFDLRECVESALDVLGARAAEKNIDLLCEFAPGVREAVAGDDTRLRQVFVNLLSNAVKFTAQGQVLLSIDCVGREEGRQRLRFGVQDSGIGIPEDRMDRLFKSFSQVDASTTRQYGGTGLGLAICKRIVELMGGRIWVESAAGQGSTFIFEVELGLAAEVVKPFASANTPFLAGRRVLIVDDNPASRRVLCQQCAGWGMVPRAVASGREALVALDDGTPCDLVVMDADMPDLNGPETLALIRRRHAAAALPVAMLVRPGHARGTEAFGVAMHVTKPIKTAALMEAIVGIFRGSTVQPLVPLNDDATIATGHPLTILLAEDNPVNQRVASLMLQRFGYRADVVANGREAIDAVARRNYDLVLMDVQMPEMDGLEAAREICLRRQPAMRPRIVAMTANASTSDRDQCLAAGMDDFLSKPVRQADLKQALLATTARCAADQACVVDSNAA